MYVWYVTNEYNFEKLKDVPTYEPTKCSTCGHVIQLGMGGYSYTGKKYFCMNCSDLPQMFK
jgi:DNA-directed RNA polymerase subunit RPC12/RpoP